MATGVMATTAPWASASVLERMTVMRPLPSSQRWTFPQVSAAASERRNPPVGQDGHQGKVETGAFSRLLGRLHAAAAGTGFRSGEADDGQHVGGEGAGLALGLRKSPSPSFQSSAACWGVSMPRPRARGFGAVRRMTDNKRAHPGPDRAIHGRPTGGPWRWRWWPGAGWRPTGGPWRWRWRPGAGWRCWRRHWPGRPGSGPRSRDRPAGRAGSRRRTSFQRAATGRRRHAGCCLRGRPTGRRPRPGRRRAARAGMRPRRG